MANSKLLKEAIADAKAVKETALANAKLALEEAFTPRLQSILSKKLREEEDTEAPEAPIPGEEDQLEEELTSSGIGSGNEKTPKANKPLTADTDLSVGVKKSSAKPGAENKDLKKVADISEAEEVEDEKSKEEMGTLPPAATENLSVKQLREKLQRRLAELDAVSPTTPPVEGEEDEEVPPPMEGYDGAESDEIDLTGAAPEEKSERLDLEAIIKELEDEMGDEEDGMEMGGEEDGMEMDDEEDDEEEIEDGLPGMDPAAMTGAAPDAMPGMEDGEEDEVVDLEEILREMEQDLAMQAGAPAPDEEEDTTQKLAETKKQLKEAMSTIGSLRKTINEVNLLNAKLLFANKLFRAHNMTNEQKVKIIETLDRTKSVREVKLVYSTLAENLRYGTNKAAKKSITEGMASKVVKSTSPSAQKQVISEAVDFSARFKKLAGIIK